MYLFFYVRIYINYILWGIKQMPNRQIKKNKTSAFSYYGRKEMNIIGQMSDRYRIETENDAINAVKEVFQEIALLGLYRSGFFEKACFCGGTALRILYGLDRFSEDLDKN